MTDALSPRGAISGNPLACSILTASNKEAPTETPDSERLLGPVWTPSGLALNAPCRLYCGDRWRSGRITATGETSALVATSAGLARCSDRRNLLNEEEARLFRNSQTRWRRQRAAAHRSEEGQTHG
jgi:hypothetical protein